MGLPYDEILQLMGQDVINAEQRLPTLLRTTIDPTNLQDILEILKNKDYRLHSIFGHELNQNNEDIVELQYLFSTLYNNRDYQLILCIQVSLSPLLKTNEKIYVLSVKEWFPTAEIFEAKLESEWGILFSSMQTYRGAKFNPYPRLETGYAYSKISNEKLNAQIRQQLKHLK